MTIEGFVVGLLALGGYLIMVVSGVLFIMESELDADWCWRTIPVGILISLATAFLCVMIFAFTL